MVPDQTKVFWLLESLGSGYENFVTSMLKSLVPSFKEIIPLLQSHEARTLLYNFENNGPPQMAFFAKTSHTDQHSKNDTGKNFVQRNTNNGNRGNNGPQSGFKNMYFAENTQAPKFSSTNDDKKEAIICQIYGKKNHTALKCFNPFNHSYQSK